ncbi:hypothetical protein [Pseudomonas sp. gcc21]|nr:hypothetical protein [Pseudomonas sp. gcc21]
MGSRGPALSPVTSLKHLERVAELDLLKTEILLSGLPVNQAR